MAAIYVITDSGLLVSVADLSCASVAAAMNGPGPAAQLGVSPGYLGVLSCPHDPVVVGDVLTSPGLGSTNVLAFGQPYVPGGGGSSSTGTSAGTLSVDTPLFNIDSAGGAALSLAILGVWAVGWSVRMAIRALSVDGVRPGGSDE